MRPYEIVLHDLEDRGALPEYERGYLSGLRAFAWTKDGVLYVGTTGKTLALAVEQHLRSLGLWPEEGS